MPKDKIKIFPGHTSVENFFEIFLSALTQHGFTLLQYEKKSFQFVEIHASNHIPLVLAPGVEPPKSDAFFTQIIQIEHARAHNVARTLKPIQGPYSRMSLDPASNSLILVDSGVNLRRLRALIRRLDHPKATHPEREETSVISDKGIREVEENIYEIDRARFPSFEELLKGAPSPTTEAARHGASRS